MKTALKAAQEKLKQAKDVKSQSEKRVDEAKNNQPKNVSIALVSTPIRVRRPSPGWRKTDRFRCE